MREAVRAGLASAGYAPAADLRGTTASIEDIGADTAEPEAQRHHNEGHRGVALPTSREPFDLRPQPQQDRIAFGVATAIEREAFEFVSEPRAVATGSTDTPQSVSIDSSLVTERTEDRQPAIDNQQSLDPVATARGSDTLSPLDSAIKFVREVAVESLSSNIRPLGQLDESFIIATDDEGLLLIDQHVAHERVLFDKYRALEASRRPESQHMLIPETFDLTPAQAGAFDDVATELESYGFELMRLSGRTVAIKSTPSDLPASEARNVLAEVLDTVDAEKKGAARATLRDEIAASLACHAAIKVNMPLAPEKMRWLIDRLLTTSSPTTCPHGRPVILRLATQDILKGFHRI